MYEKKSSNYSLDNDTVELFNKHDIRAYNKNRYKNAYRKHTALVLTLLLVICLSAIALIKITFSGPKFLEQNSDHSLYLLENYLNDSLVINSQSNEKIKSQSKCDNIAENDRIDCNPDQPITESVCESRGCCWDTNITLTVNHNHYNNPPVNVPYCYYGNNYVGYEVTNTENYLYRTVITLNRKIYSGFVRDSQTVKLEIFELNGYTIRLKFYDPMIIRYEVPIPRLNIIQKKSINDSLYTITVSSQGLLDIKRKNSFVSIFKTDLKRLTFSDQFLQLSSDLPSNYIYGIGEHKDGFRKSADWKRYTLYNRDHYPIPKTNLYGSHPFYLTVEDNNGNSDGVFLFNSNAMDIILQPKPAITWRTIGGILDFYVFLGPQPSDVIRQYNQLIGLPSLPPYWALGFHLCRYGYNSLNKMKKVFDRTRAAGIPYDVQWNDIDVMKNHNDFTYDNNTFRGLPEFVDHLHEIGMKYITMIDPGISSGESPHTYPPYDEGLAMDIFVKDWTGKPFEGKVWNKVSTVWPDFTNPKTTAYWTRQLAKYHSVVEFDGAWIDMNEPSNFYDGTKDGCPQTQIENPQYIPGADSVPLRTSTVCASAQQYAGLHYDVHNLYGFTEAIATNIALRTIRQNREVIISRSSFPGHGHYAGHWDGDIQAVWEDMRWTIPSILNFNMFGIPFVGGDICGFGLNTTVELCSRWQELGAFYPFSRNHNSDDCIDQDPVALGPVVVESAKNSLQTRYALLPYLYTLFFRANIYGDTVVRPLFFEYPTDSQSYEIETQFLWGSALMIVPTLYENATSVNAYLPPDIWYHLNGSKGIASQGQHFELLSPITAINVLLRGGHIVAKQSPKTTTEETRKTDFSLIVGLNGKQSAKGELYWDSGDGLDNMLIGKFNCFQFIAQNNSLTSLPVFYGLEMDVKLSDVVIMGVNNKPNMVTVNNVKTSNYKFLENENILIVNNIDGNLSQKIVISWI